MQGGQGRGGGRAVYSGGGRGWGRGGGIGGGGLGYPAYPGFSYGNWGNTYHMPGFYPAPPPVRAPYARGSGVRPFAPLGVQGGGVVKRPASASNGPLANGRGHSRPHGGRGWGGRKRNNLTKEALDADLDEWRLKDKKFGGQSLDADLDEYWKKKDDDADGQKSEANGKDPEVNTEEDPNGSSGGGAPSVSRSEESPEQPRTDDASPYGTSPAKTSSNVSV